MGNMNIQNYGQDKEIVLGDGFYESGKVTIAANGEVVQGDLLARNRNGSGKFIPYTGIAVSGLIDPICAIYTGREKLEGGSSGKEVPITAFIAGPVDGSKIKVAGTDATALQKDLAKAAGIIPVTITEMNSTDNQ